MIDWEERMERKYVEVEVVVGSRNEGTEAGTANLVSEGSGGSLKRK